jgi:hypothetical protein
VIKKGSLSKDAVACLLSGPADGGKPKWATFKALRNGRKFWLLRADRLKRTRLFGSFWGDAKKNNNLKLHVGLLTFSAGTKYSHQENYGNFRF